MPKNNNQTSVLDKLQQEMSEQSAETKQEATGTIDGSGVEQGVEGTQEAQEAQEEKETYVPRKDEKHLYHVRMEKPLYNKKTGDKISKSFVQKFTEPEYNALVGKVGKNDKSNADMLGYEVKVLWNPKENI